MGTDWARFDQAWVLWLLPLAALPLLAQGTQALPNGWLALAPRDGASVALGWALRAAAALAVAALLLLLAGPYRPEYTVERVGQGAEIALVLDRSRSMDQGFAPGGAPPPGMRPNSPEALAYQFSRTPGRLRESKGLVARRLLGEFTAQRPDDRFALIVFSTLPLRVLDFTDKQEVVQAGIAAGNIGRGLSETNIGRALESALELFDGRPYTGSRIVMLVSDGGDQLDTDTREHLAHLMRKQRVSLYWLYLRSSNSPGLKAAASDGGTADNIPEVALNAFFQSLNTPYRAYEASDSQVLAQAIEDVNRLEKLPITYRDLIPRRDLRPFAQAFALGCVLLLVGANLVQIRRWQ